MSDESIDVIGPPAIMPPGFGLGEEIRSDARPLYRLLCAYHDLQTDGWRPIMYAPKDGTVVEIIELGSTGIHEAHHHGPSWWVSSHDDLWPSDPILWRAKP